jgi:hypothetical protein
MKKLGLMVCGSFPDIRVGRITEGLSDAGWDHDLLTRRVPAQFSHAYRSMRADPYWDYNDYVVEISRSGAEIIHVHCELYDYWPVAAAINAADGRPVIANIHDLSCARSGSLFDPWEPRALAGADALVWVTDGQRDFAKSVYGLADRPSCTVTNYASSSCHIDRPILSHIGGVVYAGGIQPRGDIASKRDLSPMVDALGGQVHIYPGNDFSEYGIIHAVEYEYPLYMERLARHDWGLAGFPVPDPSWEHSFPTKVGEYLAAGLPFIAMNVPELIPLAKAGLGIHVTSLADLKRAARQDPKPYAKRVKASRGRYTSQKACRPLAEMYGALL